MSSHLFDNEFLITREQKEKFQRDGFVKLEGFFNSDVVNTLIERVEVELGRSPGNFKREFNRLTYGTSQSDKTDVYELLERPYFRRALTELVERDLFLTFELCFELKKNVSKGFPWHVGVQSFGYQAAEDFGCTIWAPLHPVDVKGQRGGMAYVPQSVISGKFIFEQIESAVVSTLEAKEQAGVKTSVQDYFAMRLSPGLLNSQPILDILEYHQVEDDFEPGDVLLFNKYVVHRSIMLEEGMLPRRAAFVMRFVEAGSRYDLQRARNIEYPFTNYGYKSPTRSHIEIAEAGALNGAVLAECSYFDNRDRRMVRRERSPKPS